MADSRSADARLQGLKETLLQLSGEEWSNMLSRTGLGDGLTFTNSYTDWD